MGRWINRDPLEEDGGLNLYMAFANGPTNFVDDYGEQVVGTIGPTWLGPLVGIGARPPVHLPRGGTYFLRNAAGRIMRSGRTNDLARRAGEHKRDPALSRFRFRVDKRTDNRAAQKGREHIIHEKHKPPLNKIRPLDPKKMNTPKYQNYLKEGGKLSAAGESGAEDDVVMCEPDNRNLWQRFKDWWSGPAESEPTGPVMIDPTVA